MKIPTIAVLAVIAGTAITMVLSAGHLNTQDRIVMHTDDVVQPLNARDYISQHDFLTPDRSNVPVYDGPVSLGDPIVLPEGTVEESLMDPLINLPPHEQMAIIEGKWYAAESN